MISHPRPLIEVFAEMPDFRSPRGKRHPLVAILALTCSAMLCGSRSYTAIAEWGRNEGARLMQAVGFPRQPPCAATLHTVLRRVDREAVEAKLLDEMALQRPSRLEADTAPTGGAVEREHQRVVFRACACDARDLADPPVAELATLHRYGDFR